MDAVRMTIDYHRPNSEQVQAVANMLAEGKVIIYPTDTIYGLGCDAFNPIAVERVNRLKSRSAGRPLLVLIPDGHWVDRLTSQLPDVYHQLSAAFWPGPLTLILRASVDTPGGVLGDSNTIGIRWPKHPFLQQLLSTFGGPIVSTSANISGCHPLKNPGTEENVILQEVDCVVDSGELSGKESTVLDLTGSHVKLLREGAVASAVLEAFLGGLS